MSLCHIFGKESNSTCQDDKGNAVLVFPATNPQLTAAISFSLKRGSIIWNVFCSPLARYSVHKSGLLNCSRSSIFFLVSSKLPYAWKEITSELETANLSIADRLSILLHVSEFFHKPTVSGCGDLPLLPT